MGPSVRGCCATSDRFRRSYRARSSCLARRRCVGTETREAPLMDHGTVDTPVWIRCAMWIPFGPKLRARLCAVARGPAFAAAKAAKPRRRAARRWRRWIGVTRPRGGMWHAASPPVATRRTGSAGPLDRARWFPTPPNLVFTPAWTGTASSGPTSRSMVSNRATTAPSSPASVLNACARPPAATMASTVARLFPGRRQGSGAPS